MTTYVDKPLSLIEKKKQQWAKEREELAGLCAPWGSNSNINTNQNLDRPFQRSRYVSRLAMVNQNNSSPIRRSSLPPLYKNQYNSIDREMMGGGETSGYGSDNPNHWNNNNNQSGYESSSSYKDDRPKWRDKSSYKFWGVDNNINDPPNWVKRGLQNDEEIIVSNTSPAESPQQDLEQERPYTSSSFHRTFIRGQNIPVDSAELAERERRRQIALEHQEAIRQQLEEREKRRQEEREKRIKEEREEELRIEREQEIERQRKERELQQIREKQEREKRRKQAIQEALEIAEREAQIEREKRKNKHKIEEEPNEHDNNNNNIKVIHNDFDSNIVENDSSNKNNVAKCETPRQDKDIILNNKNINNNNIEVSEKVINTPRISDNSNLNQQTPLLLDNTNNTNNNENIRIAPAFQVLTPRSEIAVILQTPSIVDQNLQYAVLVPTNSLAIINNNNNNNNNDNSPRTENRVLTPTQYRNKNNKKLCDSSTQTEFTMAESIIQKKMSNLELESGRKERRVKSEERPKWGANRPPTRYMKQSEKDLLYQRRKKQRHYNNKNSSDESQTNSPRSYRKKSYIEKRQQHTRALWRKNDHFFARNIRMYQTEIVPLESDKEQIYYRAKCECCCKCSCNSREVLKIDTLPDCGDNNSENSNSGYVIEKLASLHNGLLMKQEVWERSPRTPSLSSSTRNTEH